jgi:hypothetical protein
MIIVKKGNEYFLSFYKNAPTLQFTQITDDFTTVTVNPWPNKIDFTGEQRIEFLSKWFEINKQAAIAETSDTIYTF